MKVETIVIRTGIPDANGRIFTREALEALVKEDPKKYRLDEEGNLRMLLTDTETEELCNAFMGTKAEGMEGDCALEKFQAVLRYREDNLTAPILPRTPDDGESD